ncbi:hypothetical protein [Helicobacter sp. MIT 14-3879]|uniref:hypothetical protein n=1 Tax=Helicobacter sp. MIT 14-3879 TaxID=2040649 RepID=UPI000E1FB070|nr:hypothetical protein [Helicobacter sp. MIT 14-3879]RDU65092.1 hypothetical protein CQA44_01920 [Helicobacter sp. MIT 14-3879]
MVFLLVNTNPAVRKIFDITAKKAAIKLDVVNSISQIPLNEDYSCIFVDDGVLNTGSVESFRNKMITTKFCLIVSKDSQLVSGFDSYIRKPFLPTDIYEVLNKEKHSDINLSTNTYEDIEPSPVDDNLANSISLDDINNNDIDLSEFNDNNDEFLSGVKDINNINLDSFENSQNIVFEDDLISSKIQGQVDTQDLVDNNLEQTKPIEEIPIDEVSNTPISKNQAFLESQAETEIVDNAESFSDFNDNIQSSDDIDFSSIFELQNEFLQEEEKGKKKPLIGGDGYKKKEPPKELSKEPGIPQANQGSIESEIQNMEDVNFPMGDSTQDLYEEDITLQPQEVNEQNIESNNFDYNDNNDNISFDIGDEFNNMSDEVIGDNNIQHSADIIDNISNINEQDNMDFHTDINPSNISNNQKYNMLGLPINDSGDIVDINDLSEEELEKLDDETLLMLQEKSLDNLNAENTFTTPSHNIEPKVLNKQDINELTNILEDTQSNNFSIQNNEFGSLTQEALSEVLGESNAKSFELNDNFPNSNLDAIETVDSSNTNTNLSSNQSVNSDSVQNTQNQIQSNINDLTEIIKTFPIDKLRELLSGVQITINITFPTKK